MKKKYFSTILIITMLCITNLSFAQPPLPNMYVNRDSTNARILQFSQIKSSKYERLTKLNGYQDLFMIYTKNAVESLLSKINTAAVEGVRIYFARYNKCENFTLPLGTEDDKVILLFASEPKKGTSPDIYYFLNDKGNDDKSYPVSKDCGQQWIDDYNEKIQPELLQTLNENDKDNEDPIDSKNYFDTKSIFYQRDSIQQAFTEEEAYLHYLNKKLIHITGYKVSFSAYPYYGDQKNRYKKRLFIQFDYMYDRDGQKEVFYLDDLDDFKQRMALNSGTKSLGKKANKKTLLVKTKKSTTTTKKSPSRETSTEMFIDNGQLCPTNCPK